MDSYSSSMLCLQWRGSVISYGVVAVTFDIHFTTSGQSRRDGASSNGLAIVILIQSSLPSLHPTNEVTEKFVERYSNIKFLQGYGLTETAAIVASMFTKEETERYGSSGLLAPNMDGKIVDPDTGRVLGVHRTGELWLRSPTVMKCDWFFSKRCFCFWYEFIKCNGYQVAPAELEALLFAHPEIADASVIPIPDLKAGQYPMAYIARTAGSNLSEKSLWQNFKKRTYKSHKLEALANHSILHFTQQVYSKLLRPSFVTVRAMSESQTALKNQPQSSASSEKQLDGRVKSLHPNIHGGILARRDVEHHMEALNEHGISTFDGNLLWNRTIPPPSPIRPERLDVSDNPTAKQTPCLLCCTQRSVLSYTASTSPSYW
ncbi:hypothetical protein Bca4012_075421 [Brassica carinata]